MGGRKKQVKREHIRNVRLTPAEDRFVRNAAKDAGDTVSNLLRQLVQREKKVVENRRARWGKRARKYLSSRQCEALKIILDEARWKERASQLLGENEVEAMSVYFDGLFYDLDGELNAPLDEPTSLPPLQEPLPPPG